MKNILLLVFILPLAACAPKIKDIKADSFAKDTGLLIVSSDVTFDGEKKEDCVVGSNTKGVKLAANEDNLRVFSVAGGKEVSLDGMLCIENKVLYAKSRMKHFKPGLVVTAEPNAIVYPGTVVIDWDSEGFGLLDVLNGGGSLVEDDGSLAMKREGRSDEIKSKIQKDNPALLEKFKFVTKKFQENPNLIQ